MRAILRTGIDSVTDEIIHDPREHPRQLAQFNIAKMRYQRWSREMVSYHESMDAVFPVAKSWPGFVWLMADDELLERAHQWYGPDAAANISVWADVESLRSFMNCPPHMAAIEHGSKWFIEQDQPTYVFWWIECGYRPSFDEASERLEMLRRLGPMEQAFTLGVAFPPPG